MLNPSSLLIPFLGSRLIYKAFVVCWCFSVFIKLSLSLNVEVFANVITTLLVLAASLTQVVHRIRSLLSSSQSSYRA